MEGFQQAFEKYAVLFFLTPLIAAIAGNVGVQSSAIIVQGLANDDIKGSVNNRLIKEMLLAALNGIILAPISICICMVSKGSEYRFCNLSIFSCGYYCCGLIGTFIPLFLHKRSVDISNCNRTIHYYKQ